jgi:hypothetical protein
MYGVIMKFRNIFNLLAFHLFLFVIPVWSQNSEPTKITIPNSWEVHKLSDQDVVFSISSIEWGTPDCWSITSKYVHMFEKYRDNKKWLNMLTVTLSPGISGGRFGIGYCGMYIPPKMKDLGFPIEIRAVLLRTWGNPLSSPSNCTFVGPELRTSFIFIGLAIGYYSLISGSSIDRKQFYGFHISVGM